MALFNFFKKKKEEKIDNIFVGRYQQILFIRQILGEDVPALEIQIATNKDLSERNEIVEKLENLEKYMHSDFFTNQFDVSSASKDISEIAKDGYNNSVLPNDSELEERVLTIYHNIIEYTKNFAKKNGSLTEEENANFDKIISRYLSIGLMTWMTLGDKLQTSDEQHAWVILSSLSHANKESTGFDKGDLVKTVLTLLSLKDVKLEAEQLREMKKRLLESKKISDHEANMIEELIEQGLDGNKRLHEQYPDRR